jgi:hypothetical protein
MAAEFLSGTTRRTAGGFQKGKVVFTRCRSYNQIVSVTSPTSLTSSTGLNMLGWRFFLPD